MLQGNYKWYILNCKFGYRQSSNHFTFNDCNLQLRNPLPATSQLRNPQLRNPQLRNPQLRNPQLHNLQLHNPQLHNPQLRNPHLHNLQLRNLQLHNLQRASAHRVALLFQLLLHTFGFAQVCAARP
jgi:uncharacterized protein YjbI with pentapeptide repeats